MTPHRGWFDFHLSEIWQYRDLLKIYIRRNIIAQYKQTILGPIWIIIPPILTTLVFTVIFGNIANISTEGLPKPLFYMAGIITWNYFSTALTSTSNSLAGNAGIYGKVYFPRIIIPLATLISSLVRYFIQLMLFFSLLGYFIINNADSIQVQLQLIWLLPVLVILMGIQGLGFGLLFSAITSKYRDVRFLIGFGVQLLMYASPVIFPLSIVPEKYKWIILANPMSAIVESFRYMVFEVGQVCFNSILYTLIFTGGIFFLGFLFFNHTEKDFIDNA
ncbi:MAG: ABC transporter permease [Candidatus Marinimicrobia bacterium]|nr:ABC transporter permease [Candidatus Neomarinimicrobiota bacterium]